MSGSANKGWLRWCYSLVESSMNDTVRSNGRSVLPPLLCRGPGVESAHRPRGRSPDTLLGPETSGPCEQQSPELSRPTAPPTHQWPGRAGPHIDLLIVDASIFATFLSDSDRECRDFQSLSHVCERRLVFCS